MDLQKLSTLIGLLLVLKDVLKMTPRFWPPLTFQWNTAGWVEHTAVQGLKLPLRSPLVSDPSQSTSDNNKVQLGRCCHKVALAGQETRAGFPRARLDLQEPIRPHSPALPTLV